MFDSFWKGSPTDKVDMNTFDKSRIKMKPITHSVAVAFVVLDFDKQDSACAFAVSLPVVVHLVVLAMLRLPLQRMLSDEVAFSL